MRKIITQILTFTAIYMVIFALMRAVMLYNLIERDIDDWGGVFWHGLGHDMRTFSAIFLPIFLCGFLSYLGGFIRINLAKFYQILSSIYIAIVSFIVVIFAFINYYYYQIYQNKIDMFIFGLKDDDTAALISIILNDYPVILILLCALVFAILCGYLNSKILKIKFKKSNQPIWILIICNIILIYAYTVALRAHPVYNALRASTYQFSTFKPFNEISTNPIMALSWAIKEYKNQANFPYVDINRGKELQKRLFDMFATTKQNSNHAKMHIHFNLMESFGLGLLQEDEKLEKLLLGSLYSHFQSDFVFKRFLPSTNGTIDSLNRILFQSPIINLTSSKFQKTKLPYTVIDTYKKAGYRVVFAYAGNSAWYNINYFLKAQGVDEIIDETILMQEYTNAKESKHPYGIKDEYMYNKIYEIFNNATKPTLIISLGISNHPPYLHKGKNELNLDLNSSEISRYSTDYKALLNAYSYANNSFGDYLNKIKNSKFKDKIIVAATGDHANREYKFDYKNESAFGISVPFYLYIPQNLQNNIYYDKDRIGSHKDIFPTLYNLSLNNTKYLSMGGRDMLSKPNDTKMEFAMHINVWADNDGIYPISSTKGYRYQNSNTLKNSNDSFELDESKAQFHKLYEEFSYYQLAWRLGLMK
ncbi:LTA synthase family protein [Campylobacter devanensis]|uniref:LTA synthase family protein n=1 Tax=Campylobacter devanensis TaxID=3161138 RepID=UPI000A33C55D|nr:MULTISPECIES: alkaline phosphatase family protein [unclassified Campylobacter]